MGGWGPLGQGGTIPPPQGEALRDGRVNVQDCPEFLSSSSTFCAGGETTDGNGIGTCGSEDDGAPLVCERDGAFVLEGVSVLSIDCQNGDVPDLYNSTRFPIAPGTTMFAKL